MHRSQDVIRVLRKLRCSLGAENVQTIICTAFRGCQSSDYSYTHTHLYHTDQVASVQPVTFSCLLCSSWLTFPARRNCGGQKICPVASLPISFTFCAKLTVLQSQNSFRDLRIKGEGKVLSRIKVPHVSPLKVLPD